MASGRDGQVAGPVLSGGVLSGGVLSGGVPFDAVRRGAALIEAVQPRMAFPAAERVLILMLANMVSAQCWRRSRPGCGGRRRRGP